MQAVLESTNDDATELMKKLGIWVPGVYTISDPHQVEFLGSNGDFFGSYFELKFKPCLRSEDSKCASEEVVRAFLSEHLLLIYGVRNYIDMSEILP